MGQTLPNGIYLPAEGERNCYDGLEGNWRSLDGLISTVAGKASATHTHGNISNDGKVGTTANLPLITGTGGAVQAGAFGNQANTFCEGNDSRLSDARTPVAHTHTKSDVTDLFNSANTWTENNTFSKQVCLTKVNDTSLKSQNSRAGLGETNLSGDTYTQISFEDKNGDNFGYLRQIYGADGNNGFHFFVRNKFLNGVLDTTGTVDYTYFGLRLNPNKSKEGVLRGTFRPYDNNTYDLGSSSYQWNNLYAKNYYYNGTAWGLDKDNTWTGNNTFSDASNCVLSFEFGSSGSYSDIRYYDSNNSNYACLRSKVTDLALGLKYSSASNWYDGASITISNNGNVQIKAYDGTESWTVNFTPVGVYPTSDKALELGTSTHKWKTLNGVNPGALSFPDFANADPIDFRQWDVTGAVGLNYYTPTVNGWLNISIWDRATNSIFVYRSGKERVSVFGNGSMASDGRIALLMPVKANATYTIIIKASANSDIYAANFFPCLGNV